MAQAAAAAFGTTHSRRHRHRSDGERHGVAVSIDPCGTPATGIGQRCGGKAGSGNGAEHSARRSTARAAVGRRVFADGRSGDRHHTRREAASDGGPASLGRGHLRAEHRPQASVGDQRRTARGRGGRGMSNARGVRRHWRRSELHRIRAHCRRRIHVCRRPRRDRLVRRRRPVPRLSRRASRRGRARRTAGNTQAGRSAIGSIGRSGHRWTFQRDARRSSRGAIEAVPRRRARGTGHRRIAAGWPTPDRSDDRARGSAPASGLRHLER